jgi:hypothetical protein
VKPEVERRIRAEVERDVRAGGILMGTNDDRRTLLAEVDALRAQVVEAGAAAIRAEEIAVGYIIQVKRLNAERADLVAGKCSEHPLHWEEGCLRCDHEMALSERQSLYEERDAADKHLGANGMGIGLAAEFLAAVRAGTDNPDPKAYGHQWAREFFDGRVKR